MKRTAVANICRHMPQRVWQAACRRIGQSVRRLPSISADRNFPFGFESPTAGTVWLALLAASGRRKAGRMMEKSDGVCVGVAEHLTNRYGVDVQKAVARYPPLKRYSLERVQQVTSYLEEELKVDVKRVVTNDPAILSCKMDSMEERVRFLRSHNINVTQLVNAFPSVMRLTAFNIQSKLDIVTSRGIDASELVNRQPVILRTGLESLKRNYWTHTEEGTLAAEQASIPGTEQPPLSQVQYLQSLGVDMDRVLSKWPQLCGNSVEKMQKTVRYIQSLGINEARLLKSAPQVLSFRLEVLQEKVAFLEQNGLTVAKHLQTTPHLLTFSVDRKLKPILKFVLNDMGRSLHEVDRFPMLWNCSLERRIRPRFLYLKSLGKEGCSLSVLLFQRDETFACKVAGRDAAHYAAWRKQHLASAL
eukprot:GGOE01013474.1.p1 GENE.GGOE01013474.1~~GGOE01013474.1.p1  ORF type:complete len:417 (+),score=84.46 GGOE01013474.1:65-1315(+)